MEQVSISGGPVSEEELKELRDEADGVLKLLRREDCEAVKPFFFEFGGTPKSGKSTIIGIVCHFLHRVGFSIIQPAEGASLRTPEALRDDWLAFNAWSACYALRHILELSHEQQPPDVVILDRGLFDATGWMRMLETSQGRLSDADRASINEFITLDLWRKREKGVFLFVADRETSLAREVDCKLVSEHGSVMNPDVLAGLNDAYDWAANEFASCFPLFKIDTSFVGGRSPSFQRIAFTIAERILALMREALDQKLLMTEPVDIQGLEESPDAVGSIIEAILNDGQPRFERRSDAESRLDMMQVVPYGLLKNAKEEYLVLRRRSDHPRKELQGKYTMLLGGHAEQKDWNSSDPESVFERCLRRELEEELIGVQIHGIRRVGVINDPRSKVGLNHLAILFEVKVGGPPKIRRQAIDQEFGREPLCWKSGSEIAKLVGELDPWSQLVAKHKFNASVPELPGEPTLFTRGRSGST